MAEITKCVMNLLTQIQPLSSSDAKVLWLEMKIGWLNLLPLLSHIQPGFSMLLIKRSYQKLFLGFLERSHT